MSLSLNELAALIVVLVAELIAALVPELIAALVVELADMPLLLALISVVAWVAIPLLLSFLSVLTCYLALHSECFANIILNILTIVKCQYVQRIEPQPA